MSRIKDYWTAFRYLNWLKYYGDPEHPAWDRTIDAFNNLCYPYGYDDKWYKRMANKHKALNKHRIIADRESKEPYMDRFYLVPRWLTLGMVRVVVHRFWKGDTDSAWHDHPWPWGSYILEGGYWEHRPDPVTKLDVRTWRGPGSFAVRKATDLHYVELDPATKEVWTMFFMFTPAFRKWGFRSFDWKTWTYWETYLENRKKNAKDKQTS